MIKYACLCWLALLAVQPAQAANNVLLQLTAEEEITVTNAQGKEVRKRIAADAVEPGDVIVYTLHYHNQGKKAVEKLVLNDPIPQDTSYIANSAYGRNTVITFSLDGKHFASAAKLMVTTKKGKKRVAKLDEYRHVRWTFKSSLSAGKKGNVGFKARVK